MKELIDISLTNEVWKPINEFDSKIHKSWVISNYGRVFRLPYRTENNQQFPLKEVTQFIQPNTSFNAVTVGIGKYRTKLSVPLMVKFLFDSDFVYVEKGWTHVDFNDGNNQNNHVDNIIIFYSLSHQPDLVFEFYKLLSDSVKNKKYQYLRTSEIRDLDKQTIERVWDEFTYTFDLPHKLKPTGNNVLKLISDTLKINGEESGGINSFLVYNGLQPHNGPKESIDNFRYISNLGVLCDSRVECFVRNVYELLGFVGEDFKRKNLSQLTGKKDLYYNPIPDEYFYRPKFNQLIVSETFGLSPEVNPTDERQLNYIRKSKQKKELYRKFGFLLVELWVHGLTLREVLSLMNNKLMELDLISHPVCFTEDLLPKVEKTNIESSLLEFKDMYPLFEMKDLERENPTLCGLFRRHCVDLEITPVEYLDQRIFPEIELPIGEGGFVSMKAHKRQILIAEQTEDIIKSNNLTSANQIQKEDNGLYWRIWRMCKTNNVIMSDYLRPFFGKTKKN